MFWFKVLRDQYEKNIAPVYMPLPFMSLIARTWHCSAVFACGLKLNCGAKDVGVSSTVVLFSCAYSEHLKSKHWGRGGLLPGAGWSYPEFTALLLFPCATGLGLVMPPFVCPSWVTRPKRAATGVARLGKVSPMSLEYRRMPRRMWNSFL